MKSPTCLKCQSHEIRREERRFLYRDLIIPEPFKLMWQCLNSECKHIWDV
jgi:hypothetical protein